MYPANYPFFPPTPTGSVYIPSDTEVNAESQIALYAVGMIAGAALFFLGMGIVDCCSSLAGRVTHRPK